MEEFISDIESELCDYLGDTDEIVSERVVERCVSRAINSVKNQRRYPSDYTDDMISSDIESFKGAIFDIALFNYVTIGAEFQSQHTENDTNRTWKDVKNVMEEYNIIPISHIV